MKNYDYLKCSSCKILKSTKEFYRSSNDRGFRYYCIECEKKHKEEKKQKQIEYNKKWYAKNKSKLKKKKISYSQDAKIKMKKNVREFFIDSVKYNKNDELFEKTFGYKLSEVRLLETQFKNGMRWGNLNSYWNFYNWIPETAYNFSDEREIKKCWNLKNIYMCLNEDYVQTDKISISDIKEKELLDFMPDFLVLT